MAAKVQARRNRKPTHTSGQQRIAIPAMIRNSTVSQWGNSLGLRIPQEAAEQLSLKAGEQVSIEVRSGVILVKPMRKKWTEAELLQGVTPEMVGGEIDWGKPVGKEVW